MDIGEYLTGVEIRKRKNFILSALRMGVKVKIISADFRLLEFSWRGRKRVLLNDRPYFNSSPSTSFTKNKELTKILLERAGIRVPRGAYAGSASEALRLMHKLGIFFPIVIKPIDAAEGFCVTIGVGNESELRSTVKKMQASLRESKWNLSGLFMVEKLVKGNDFRILVLNGKIIACAQRVPAYIEGDGKTKIRDLIKKFNSARLFAYLLKIDTDIMKLLKEKSLTLNSILENRTRLQLRRNANISTGGRAIDKTGAVSKRFRDIALRSIGALGLNYGGIDIMTDDISSNNPRQPYFVIEINGAPDYDPHEKPLVSGKGVRVSELLVREFMGQKDIIK